MAKVVMYTKAFCPYCSRAAALLGRKGVEVEEIDITLGGAGRTEMLARSAGRTTVPQIFVGDTHVGGYDDLAALEQAGRLDPLLER